MRYADMRFDENEAREYAEKVMIGQSIPEIDAAMARGTYRSAWEVASDFGPCFPWSTQPREAVARILRETAEFQEFVSRVIERFGAEGAKHFDLSEEALAEVRA